MSGCSAPKPREGPIITSGTALLAYLRVALADQLREHFRVLFLDRRNQLMRGGLVAFEFARAVRRGRRRARAA